MRRIAVPVIAAALLPVAAAAQSSTVVTPFAARNGALDDPANLLGLSVASYSGVIGYRFGGAFDLRMLSGGLRPEDRRAWTADVDLVLSPSRTPVVGALLGSFLPTLFAGVGAQGFHRPEGDDETTPVLSYGVGASTGIIPGLRLETEARRRVPTALDGGGVSDAFPRGWEYRVGIALGFGGSGRPAGIPGRGRESRSPSPSRPSARIPSAPASASARRVLDTADDYLGTPYVYGGSTPKGFDCSGFVQYVFRHHDVTLPRTSRQQAVVGERLPASVSSLRAGDLMFFSQRGGGVVDHVAIYAGGSRIIHSSSSGGGVRWDDLGTQRGRWFVDHMVGARRILGGEAALRDWIAEAGRTADRLDPPDLAPRAP